MAFPLPTSLAVARLILLILPLVSTLAIPQLSQLHVISRHGADFQLSQKSAFQEEAFKQLTPVGEKQMHDLGLWLGRRYRNVKHFIGNYDPEKHRFESSDHDRTINSAAALAQGLFPPSNRPVNKLITDEFYKPTPIRMTEHKNDIYMLAYQNCPKFQISLINLYASKNWTATEASNSEFLKILGQDDAFSAFVNSEGSIPLTAVSAVFDVVSAAKTECTLNVSADICSTTVGQLYRDSLVWEKTKELAHFAESRRYGRETAGDLLGGNILSRIHERMRGLKPTEGQYFPSGEFFHYSSHYQTIMSMFAALRVPFPDVAGPIPQYGDAFIFELYEDSALGAKDIAMLYKSTESDTPIEVKFLAPCDNEVCSLLALSEIIASLTFKSFQDWCRACENESTDVCLLHFESELANGAPPLPADAVTSPPSSSASQPHNSCSDGSYASTIAGAFFAGLCVGMCIIFATTFRRLKRMQKEVEEAHLVDPDNIIDMDLS
jgi:hypothetical protein